MKGSLFMKKKWVRAAALVMASGVTAASFLPTARASLEEDRAGYDARAEEKLKQSTAIRQKIESLSEEKRILDEEAETAVADHNKCKAALEETVQRMEENTARLEEVSADYDKKSEQLGRRVRDIYINGQISYLDVLFGAHDFSDFMTRMDLLKKIIRQDYVLVHDVLDEKK